jgi:hypothetical protein
MGFAPAEANTVAHHGTIAVQCGTAKGPMSALGQKQTLGKM